MPRQTRTKQGLPGWLWFFVLLPIVLVFLLIRKRGRLPLPRPQPPAAPPRYFEPDSIPLDMEGEAGSLYDARIAAAAAESTMTGAEPAAQPQGEVVIVETRAGAALAAADDLAIVEGIGPKISALLNENGIHTFRQLAAMTELALVEILAQAKLNRLAQPGTWPEQARLAAEGKWDELSALQHTLKGGRKRPE